jgi:lipopolysaccharide transport system ATP-binding protein
MAAVENLCTRAIVLEEGQVRFDGTETEAVHFYLNSFIAHTSCLRDRTDRSGSGDLKIVAIELRNTSGVRVNTVASGQDVDVYLFFEKHSPKDYTGIKVQITVRTELEVAVFTQDNFLSKDTFGELPDSGAFVCRIPKLPLPSTSYRIDFFVTEMQFGQALDKMQDAVEMNVEPGDFFGSGRTPRLSKGVCYIPASWRLEKSAVPETAAGVEPAHA